MLATMKDNHSSPLPPAFRGVDLTEAAWREFSRSHFPRRDPSDLALGWGLALIGAVATALVLFLLYRTLATVVGGPVAPVPTWVVITLATGAWCGVVLVALGAIRRRAPARLVREDPESHSPRRHNGHPVRPS
jgi:hypothetical protein